MCIGNSVHNALVQVFFFFLEPCPGNYQPCAHDLTIVDEKNSHGMVQLRLSRLNREGIATRRHVRGMYAHLYVEISLLGILIFHHPPAHPPPTCDLSV